MLEFDYPCFCLDIYRCGRGVWLADINGTGRKEKKAGEKQAAMRLWFIHFIQSM
ncbi:hypothetical protein JNE17039_01900 [Escherichia coli]